MLAAEVDEKVVGMLGMRKLGPVDGSQLPDQIRAFVNGRQLYEHLKASVLPDYEGNGFFRQLKKKAVELNRQESKNPLWVMHSKNPKVLRESEKYERLRITFEDYRRLRAWKMSDAEAEKLKQKWDMEGWEYWIVDFLKEKEA